MWKVSKGDHVMWVLGDTQAPPGTQWRLDQVEARLAESQLLLYPGQLDFDFGFFKTIGLLTLVPSAFKVPKNPHDKTLKDVLPPEVYERWRALKIAYAPRDNDMERLRPSFAMQQLEMTVMQQLGASSRSARPNAPPPGQWLRPLVDKAAKKHKVKVRTSPEVELKVVLKNARGMLKFFLDLDLVDMKCVTQRLDYLERTIEYMKQSAAGPVQAKPPDRVADCNEPELLFKKLESGEIPDTAGILKTINYMQQQQQLSSQRLDAQWIAAAEAALAKNESTVAVLQLRQLKNPAGHIAKLRELGYEVEEPRAGVD
jgi:hypothetical protein